MAVEQSWLPGTVGDPSDSLSQDTLFFILQNSRRRETIRCLQEMGGEAEFSDVVEAVAGREFDCEPHELEYDKRKTVYTSLYQTHLPKLQDAGIVEYDRRGGYVRLTDVAGELDEYLDQPAGANGFQYVHVGLASLLLFVALANVLGAWPSVAGRPWGLVALLAVGIAGVAIVADTYR
jgi:hypothetical protein